jgi:MerR family transcriptional regulator, heat shock protein HspR
LYHAISKSASPARGFGVARRKRPTTDPSTAVYAISVAADLAGMDPQSLRLYEKRGLLRPARTDGGTRRYSAEDVERLHRIADLLDAGVNLTGIGKVFDLEDDNDRLSARNDHLEAENERLARENNRLTRGDGRGREARARPGRRPSS